MVGKYIQIIEDYFRTREILIFDDLKFLEQEDVDYFTLLKKIILDSRFLKLGDENKYGNLQIIKKQFLLNKLVHLNIRIGGNKLKAISCEDFISFMSPVFPKELVKEDFELIIHFAGKFSLAYKSQENQIVFPYSDIINKIYTQIGNYISLSAS